MSCTSLAVRLSNGTRGSRASSILLIRSGSSMARHCGKGACGNRCVTGSSGPRFIFHKAGYARIVAGTTIIWNIGCMVTPTPCPTGAASPALPPASARWKTSCNQAGSVVDRTLFVDLSRIWGIRTYGSRGPGFRKKVGLPDRYRPRTGAPRAYPHERLSPRSTAIFAA